MGGRILTLATIQLLVLVTHHGYSTGLALAGIVPQADAQLCRRSDPVMNPVYEKRCGQDVVWQIPSNPKAVLFLAHGAGKEPLSFFDPGPNCTPCNGLPEDREAVLAALHNSYAVIAVKSVGTAWEPFFTESWPPPMSQDRVNVVSIMKEWTQEHSLDHLPLAAWGHSSGGNFSSLLTLDLDIKSLVLMCTCGQFPVLERADKSHFPPTLFVPMPADTGEFGFYTLALKAIQVLQSRGVLVGKIDVWPTLISPRLFADRILCMQMSTSEKVYEAFKAEGWVNEDDYVIVNPRLNDWWGVLWKSNVLPSCATDKGGLCFAEAVGQELSVAYGEHSFSSSKDGAIFNWLDSTIFNPQQSLHLSPAVTDLR